MIYFPDLQRMSLVRLPESLSAMATERYGWLMLGLLKVGEVKIALPLVDGGYLVRSFKR